MKMKKVHLCHINLRNLMRIQKLKKMKNNSTRFLKLYIMNLEMLLLFFNILLLMINFMLLFYIYYCHIFWILSLCYSIPKIFVQVLPLPTRNELS